MKSRSALCVTAALCATILASLAPAQVSAPAPSDAEVVPEGLTASDWSSIRAACNAHQYAVVQCEDGHRARNPGQQWTTAFDGQGFTIDGGGWSWGLKLVRWGFEEHEQVVEGAARAIAEGQCLTYEWGGTLSEWYVNDTRGVEHGFTVHERPLRDAAGESGPLMFTLAVRGGLHGEVQDEGRGARFVDDARAIRLTYAGLIVLDADGRSLPALMEYVGKRLRLSIDERGARYPLTVDPIAQQAYLKASNTEASDRFGSSVSVSGDTVVVGARWEGSSATGVNGDEANNNAGSSGAAYVFVRSGDGWSQQAYLKASNTDLNDEFGVSVAVSGDTVVVGAAREDSSSTGVNGAQGDNSSFESGAAYVFVRNGTRWSQQAYLKASNTDPGDLFGWSVSVSGDTILVGAWGEDSNATGVNGDQSNNSFEDSGAAYVFVRSGALWMQQAYLKASQGEPGDIFGRSVSVSGDVAVVGARWEDSDATGVNGDQSNNLAETSGAAYVFARSDGLWTQQAYLKASNTEAIDEFGYSVSVSGDTVVVGAYRESSNATGVNGNQDNNLATHSGAAYVFLRSGAIWSQQAYLKASNTGVLDLFGSSVSVSGDTVVVGAEREDSAASGVNGDGSDNSAFNAGAAYLFVRSGGSWSPLAYVKASHSDAQDEFGFCVSVSGNTVVVGTEKEDSSATGVNGDQDNNDATLSGAAWIFLALHAMSFCDASDGALASCPCKNAGSPDAGCDNAQSTGGVGINVLAQTTSPNAATIAGTGFSTVGAPTAILIRSNSLDPAGPVVFGDGLRCVNSSPMVRLTAAATASGGVSTHFIGHGAGPGTFYYQLWYRNTPSSYCTPAAFNLSSGRALVW